MFGDHALCLNKVGTVSGIEKMSMFLCSFNEREQNNKQDSQFFAKTFLLLISKGAEVQI